MEYKSTIKKKVNQARRKTRKKLLKEGTKEHF
jgi:hypothetical protein